MTSGTDGRRGRDPGFGGHQAAPAGDLGLAATTPSSAPRCRSSASRCARRSTCAPGRRVLDVAAGNGNCSLAAARRWCDVTSTDYVPALLEDGRSARRGRAACTMRFQEADAEALPFADAAFDVVLSSFGVMFAPDQARSAARDAARLPPRRAASAWRTGRRRASSASCSASSAATCRRPPALTPPSRWGVEAHLDAAVSAQARVGHPHDDAATSSSATARPQHFIDVFRDLVRPVHKAFAAPAAGEAGSSTADLHALIRDFNAERRRYDGAMFRASLLEVVITKR